MISVQAIFAYLLYALLAVALFLILLFPDQAIKDYVDGRLATIDPSLRMVTKTIRPSLPPGLKMIDIDLNRGSGEAEIFTCDLSYDYVRINAEYTT